MENKKCPCKKGKLKLIGAGFDYKVYRCSVCQKYSKEGMLFITLPPPLMKPLTKPLLRPLFTHQPENYDPRENIKVIIVNPVDIYQALENSNLIKRFI